jgi:hypothetical protein
MNMFQVKGRIVNQDDLTERIVRLTLEKENRGNELKREVKDLYDSVSVSTILKGALHKFTSDKEVKTDLAKTGLNTGIDYLAGKLFGRSSSLKGYFSSILFGKLAGYVINKYSPAVLNSIAKYRNKAEQDAANSDETQISIAYLSN